MLKRFFIGGIALVFLYVGFVAFRLVMISRFGTGLEMSSGRVTRESPTHKVYSFSFSKYATTGEKELEIEGDSANIFSRDVTLNNVIAKAYAEESPVIITADEGVFDKTTGKVHLKKNVVATTGMGAKLLSPTLDIHPTAKQLETRDQAQVVKDNIDISGRGAEGDSELKKVAFKKNVTVVIQNLGSEGPKKPTVITCDGPLLIDYEKNIAHFTKNVCVTDDRGKLVADEMDVFYGNRTQKVEKIIATGNVVVSNPDGSTTYSDNVVYLAEEGRIILGGDTEALYFLDSDEGKKSDGEPPALFGAFEKKTRRVPEL